MVSIFTGLGSGFERGSLAQLGTAGLLGSGALGRSGEQLSLNAATGNFLISQRDEFLTGAGPDSAIGRTYNSLGNLSDENADNWRQSTDRRVHGLTGTLNTTGSTISRVSGDGSDIVYTWNSTASAYVATDGSGAYDKLTSSSGVWTWTDGDSQYTETYEAYGTDNWRITHVANSLGNALTISYSGALLDKVTTSNGEYEQYSWSGSNITQIVTGYTDLATSTAKTLTRTRYGYDAWNRLSAVTVDLTPGDNSVSDGVIYTTSYAYKTNSGADMHLVSSITESDGSSLSITYDTSQRVTNLTQTVASGVTRATNIAYYAGYTTVTDPLSQVTRLDYDSNDRLTKITAPVAVTGGTAQVTQFAYDSSGNVTSVTDPLGLVTSYTYDSAGNVLTVTDPLSNVITRTYGSRNELLTETVTGSDPTGAAVSHTTRYTYDNYRRLEYTISAEGRVSQRTYNGISETWYNQVYSGAVYDVSALGNSTALTGSQLATWASGLADKTAILESQHYFDTRGNLTVEYFYNTTGSTGSPDSNGGYSAINYTYDQAGQLLSRNVAGVSSEAFVYDGLGRITASTDLNGGTTSFAFTDAATQTVVTLASGLTQTTTYNKAGEVISYKDSVDTGSTARQYLYDQDGQVRVSTDRTGHSSYYLYDHAGRKTADIDAYGNITEYKYDADDRVIATVRYATTVGSALTGLASMATTDIASIRPSANAADLWTWKVYDSDGRTIEAIDGAGDITTYQYDGSSRLVATTSYANKLTSTQLSTLISTPPTTAVLPTADSAHDSVSRVFYDKQGLVVGTLNGEGYLTQAVYDAAGRKVKETAFATISSSSYWASGTFNQLLTSAGTSSADRISRWVYDGQGQLRYTIDSLNHVTEYGYRIMTSQPATEIGDMRTVTQYATAISALSSYTVASVAAAITTNAADRSTYAVYDSANRVAYSIDASGAATGYGYDALGRVIRTTQFAVLNTTSYLPDISTMSSWAASNANAADRITRNFYDTRGELTYTVDAEGFITRFDYDGESRQIASVRFDTQIGATTFASFTDSTTLATVAGLATGAATTVSTTYDNDGRVASTTDGLGYVTSYGYNANGTLDSTYEAYGTADQVQTKFTYDNAGRVLTRTEAYGVSGARITTFGYDGLGDVVSVTDPNTNTTTSTYDHLGRKLTQTDPLSGATAWQYDAFGDVVKVTDPRGNVSYSYYDNLGRVILSYDANHYGTQSNYTVFGELASVKRWYNPANNAGSVSVTTQPTFTAHANDATTGFTYDKLGRVLTSTDALGVVESYGYSRFARTSLTNRLGGVTTYDYDRLGRLTRQGYAATTTNYQASGNYSGGTLVTGTATTGAENVTAYTYDARGNVKQQVEGYATTVGGSVTALRTTTYNYDADNQQTSISHDTVTVIADDMVTVSSTTPSEQFTYDRRGNLILAVDAGGASTYSYYDALDRKVAEIRQLAASTWVYTAYGYDANGNLTSTKVYDANGSSTTPPTGGAKPAAPSGPYRETDATFDTLNRMLTSVLVSVSGNTFTTGSWNGSSYVTSTASLTTTYQYDADGNVVKLTAPNGAVTWSWYDALNHKTAQLDAEGYLTAWSYNAEGNVTSETRFATKFTGTPTLGTAPSVSTSGDDRTTAFVYDLNGNRTQEKRTGVVAWTVNTSTGALTAAGTDSIINYTYNALGQVLTKVEPTETSAIATYSYDTTGRLTSEQRAAFSDANGTTVTPTTSYAYDAVGDLITSTQAGTSSGTYQALQRVTTNRYGEGGRLLSTADAEGYVHQYFYDVMGRLKKDAYNRVVDSDTSATTTTTTTVAEAQTTTYDLAGRSLSQSIYSTIGGTFQRVGYFSYQYNNFGQVTAQGIGSNSASGMNAGSALFQVTNQYDASGHLAGTNSGDGVWKFYSYDAAGNQTASMTSAGASFTSSTGFAGALALVGNANVDGTYSVYDKRNLATQVIEEGRDLSGSVTNQTLNTYRSYNAFSEVASETNALGSTMTYAYNTMGRKVRSESPAVSITLENGLDIWVKPAEETYFDLAGRQIGSRDADGTYGTTANTLSTAYGKSSNTGNLTTYALLAGTGYDKGQALVATEFHADGGKKQMLYDIMGDARVTRDELYASGSPYMHVEEMRYNRLGQLIEDKHNRATNVSSASDDSTRLVDTYVNDQFGQRIQHGVSEYNYTGYSSYYGIPYTVLQLEKSGYDALGRVTSQTDLSGYVTTTSYAWDGTLNTSINGSNINFGGWVETTTNANSRTTISKQDLYNREVFNQDLGTHQVTATFDAAGRMITRGTNVYTWYNTGLVATAALINGTVGSSVYDRRLSTYGYDAVGKRTSEVTNSDGSTMVYYGSIYYSYSAPSSYSYTLVNETSTYDALGRLTAMNATATSYLPTASLTEKYDAAGNIRNTASTHAVLNGNGAVSSTVTDNYWFRYDSMNRLVTDKGTLSGTAGAAGTTIVRGNSSYLGAGGQDYVYDAAGERVASIRTDYSPGSYSYYYSYYSPGSYQETRENDEYDGAGRVADIKITQGTAASEVYNSSTGLYDPPSSVAAAAAATGSTAVSSVFTYDLMGRQLSQSDYSGTTVTYSRSASYAYNGFLSSDSSTTKKYESNGTTNLYTSYNSYSLTSSSGEYLLGAVGSVSTSNYKNSSYQNNSSTTNSYVWWGSAMQSTVAYKPNTSQSTTFNTYFNYDAQGTLMSVSINDGRPRTVTYINNGDNQIIRRDEADYNYWNASNQTGGDPHELWYRFAGKELGYVGNNGTVKLTESASIYDRQAYQANGAFRNGGSYASGYSDFAESSGGPINSYNQGAAGGSYVVQRNGETLRSIAQQIWGDASLWYKIADANGMSGDTQLVEGQHVTLPAGVARNHNNASTLTPYDSNAAIGNVSPTTPQPPKKSSCGGLGTILLLVIALAVTVIATAGAASALSGVAFHTVLTGMMGGLAVGTPAFTAFAEISATTFVAAGAVGAAVGSVVSQGIGVLTGIQDKFSWKAVGLAAIGGAVGGAIGPGGLLGKGGLFGAGAGGAAGAVATVTSPVLRAALSGIASSALTQGIGVATGLQSKFDWVGVAAAGVGAAAGQAAFGNLPGLGGEGATLGNFAAHLGKGAVSAIANAATRSAVEGSDFGDNVMAALPDVIAQTVGDLLLANIAGGEQSPGERALIDAAQKSAEGGPSTTAQIGVPVASPRTPAAPTSGDIVVTAAPKSFVDPSGVTRLELLTPELEVKASDAFLARQRANLAAAGIVHDIYDGIDYVYMKRDAKGKYIAITEAQRGFSDVVAVPQDYTRLSAAENRNRQYGDANYELDMIQQKNIPVILTPNKYGDRFDVPEVTEQWGARPTAVYWNPYIAFKENGGYMSAATALLHEIGHAFEYSYHHEDFMHRYYDNISFNKRYGNAEEHYEIRGIELGAAKFFREPTRSTHDLPRNSPIKSKSPNSYVKW